MRYLREEHRVDIHGSGDTIKQAAQLVDRNVRQYLLTRPKGKRTQTTTTVTTFILEQM